MLSTATAPGISLGATLTEEQAREIFAQGEEAVVWALVELAQMVGRHQAAASHQAPAAPSAPSDVN